MSRSPHCWTVVAPCIHAYSYPTSTPAIIGVCDCVCLSVCSHSKRKTAIGGEHTVSLRDRALLAQPCRAQQALLSAASQAQLTTGRCCMDDETTDKLILTPEGRERSIGTNVWRSVCMFARHLRNHAYELHQIFYPRLLSGGLHLLWQRCNLQYVIIYVLPVFLMTSCFRITDSAAKCRWCSSLAAVSCTG